MVKSFQDERTVISKDTDNSVTWIQLQVQMILLMILIALSFLFMSTFVCKKNLNMFIFLQDNKVFCQRNQYKIAHTCVFKEKLFINLYKKLQVSNVKENYQKHSWSKPFGSVAFIFQTRPLVSKYVKNVRLRCTWSMIQTIQDSFYRTMLRTESQSKQKKIKKGRKSKHATIQFSLVFKYL